MCTEDKLRSTSMENGVSGCRVGRACRNDNEDNALGKRATGRTSSGAHGGEPIVWDGESTAQERQKSRNWSDKSVSQPNERSSHHWPTAILFHYSIGARSLLSTERCRSRWDYKRFLARSVRESSPLSYCSVHDESRATAGNLFPVVFLCSDIHQALANTNRRAHQGQGQGEHVEWI